MNIQRDIYSNSVCKILSLEEQSPNDNIGRQDDDEFIILDEEKIDSATGTDSKALGTVKTKKRIKRTTTMGLD